MAKDRQWLKQRLCSALGWDEVVVEGVVEAIASAESAEDVDALVQVSMAVRVCCCRLSSLPMLCPCQCQVIASRITWVEEPSLSSLFRSLFMLKERALQLQTAVRYRMAVSHESWSCIVTTTVTGSVLQGGSSAQAEGHAQPAKKASVP